MLKLCSVASDSSTGLKCFKFEFSLYHGRETRIDVEFVGDDRNPTAKEARDNVRIWLAHYAKIQASTMVSSTVAHEILSALIDQNLEDHFDRVMDEAPAPRAAMIMHIPITTHTAP